MTKPERGICLDCGNVISEQEAHRLQLKWCYSCMLRRYGELSLRSYIQEQKLKKLRQYVSEEDLKKFDALGPLAGLGEKK